jgi:membrane associated rhomboid family serine protease
MVAASVGFLAVFGLLYWLVVLHWELYDPTFAVLYWGNFGLAALVLYIVLRPRLHLLRRGRDDRWVTLFYLVPMMFLVFGASFVSDYLTAATGQLTALNSPAEIGLPFTRYYTFRQAYAYKPGVGVHNIAKPTGKNNATLTMEVYAACPLFAAAPDTVGPVRAWVAWHQKESMPMSLSAAEKNVRYQRFAHRCDSLFWRADLTHCVYMARATTAENRPELEVAARRSRFGTDISQAPLVLVPQYTPLHTHTQKPLQLLAINIGVCWVVYLLMLMFPKISATQLLNWQQGQRPASTWQELRPYVLPRPGYIITPLLVAVNSLIFIGLVLSLGDVAFRASDLLARGATFGPLIVAGQWWRLLTSGFLHGNLLHWLQNMTTLGLMGWLLERHVGAGRLLLVYLLSIAAASWLSSWWHPDTVSVGASGGIFGLFGMALALAWNRRVPAEDRGLLLILAGPLCAINLVLGWLLPNTDNAAHIGGLVTGLMLGLALTYPLPRFRTPSSDS